MADSNINTYKLYLYKKTKTSSDTGLEVNNSQDMTIGGKKYAVKLIMLKYRKEVYNPCKIFTQLDVSLKSTPGTDDGTTLPTNSSLMAELLNKKVDLDINSNIVATNYFVYKVRPIYKTSSTKSMTVELTIYSPDKLMTLDKYCRAYTAKRLYTDILATESKKFRLNDDTNSSDCTKLSTLIANHMQMLKYKVTEKLDKEAKNLTLCDELRIPYVVQYNESFYDFMVRTSNRFGEFFYFEDGKLNLGMQPSDTYYYERDNKGNIKKDNNDKPIVIDWAKESNAVQSRYYESVLSEGIAVDDRPYNYKDHASTSTTNSYPTDADKRYNIDAVPADEWAKMELRDRKYLTPDDLWEEEVQRIVVDLVFRSLGASNLADFVLNIVKDFALGAWNSGWECDDFNDIMSEDNYDLVKDNSDQVSGDDFSPFATYGGSAKLKHSLTAISGSNSTETNYTNVFYPLVRKKEKEVGKQAVWLEFGDHFKPLKLGDKLCVDGIDYVVIMIEGSYEDSEEKLLISAVPVVELTSSESIEKTVDKLSDGDPWTTTLPVPPALPNVLIRDARPQVAFVAQYTDPESLGRIRVRYPWQDSEGDTSPWIRVTLPLATSGGAVSFTPSEGDEVMIGYEHGNIDHPYAMGYLTAPFVNHDWADSLPFDQWGGKHGIKVKTGHHLTFTDGANMASMLADMIGILGCVKSIFPAGKWPISNPRLADLGGGFELSDRYGFYKITGSTDERSITIESPMGTVDLSAFQGITISAPNGDVNITGKNVTITANNSLKMTSGETIKDRFYYQKQWRNNKAASIGVNFGEGLGMDALVSLRTMTFDKLIDISFLRCVLEVLLRPVDGTLQIKSYTFIQMEAGSGETEVPINSLLRDKGFSSQDNLNQTDTNLQKLARTIGLINSNVTALILPIRNAYKNLTATTQAFMRISGSDGINKNQGAAKYIDIVGYACGNDGAKPLKEESGLFKFNEQKLDLVDDKSEYDTQKDPEPEKSAKEHAAWEARKEKFEKDRDDKNAERAKNRNDIITSSNNLRISARLLSEQVKKWTALADVNITPYDDKDVDKDVIRDKIKDTDFPGSNFISRKKLEDGNYDEKIKPYTDATWAAQISTITRYVAYQYINDKQKTYDYNVGETLKDARDAWDNGKWRKFVKSIKKDDTGILKTGWNALKGYTFSKVADEFRESPWKWKNGFEGKILFSDSEAKTITFDGNNLVQTLNQNIKEANLSNLHDQLIKM